jgi:flavorubredoxin
METPFKVTQDITVLPSEFEVPGLGVVPVNAFLIDGSQPMLVDTGLVPESGEFLEALGSVVDPTSLRWIWLTHTDQDHIGSLSKLLAMAPEAKVITTFLGMGKMSLWAPLPMDRVHLLNAGQTFDLGDRSITALRPPTWDAPETTGFFDPTSGALFSADSFGAVLAKTARLASDLDAHTMAEGQTLWATVDAPWLNSVDASAFAATLEDVRKLGASWVLSAHLPPARGITDAMLATLAGAPEAPAFMGPDQAALEAMLAQMV